MIEKSSKILIVDDSATTRKIARKYFTDLGYTLLDESVDGTDAFQKIISSEPRYGLIFTDWHMPNVSGFELLEKIRGLDDPGLKQTPVILATAERKSDEVRKAIVAGVNGYIIKPYSLDLMRKAIENIRISQRELNPDEEMERLFNAYSKSDSS